jgi:hypothetical protein
MAGKTVVILDGCGLPDRDLALFLRGCWTWVKTPGMCVEDDAGISQEGR